VIDGAIPLEISLVWTDYWGTPGINPQLVNNLNLTATPDGGTTYVGNNYSDEQTVPGGTADDLNVEECIERTLPDTGLWTVRVAAATTPQGPQPYALVVTGGVSLEPTSVRPEIAGKSAGQLLASHGPNPANPSTVIRYYLPEDDRVQVTIYDVNGRIVRTLVDARQAAGPRAAAWDAQDDDGRPVSSGIYFYRVATPVAERVQKIVVSR